MKHVIHSTPRLDCGRLLTALTGSLAVGVAILASALVAQNNDNGGILPGKPGGGTTANTANGHDGVLAVSGQLEGTSIDAALPALQISNYGYSAVGLALGVSDEEAEFLAESVVVAEQLPTGGLQLQGNGTLNPEIGLQLGLHAASQALVRSAFLVGSPAGASLESVLSGATAPFALLAMGDLPSLDLAVFNDLLIKHAQPDAPFRVSVVFLSVDASGVLRHAAVSGLTGGAELDLAFE
jgi:hypothetical protein